MCTIFNKYKERGIMNPIYLDNAATTAMAPEVVEAMLPYLTNKYANPSAIYQIANVVKDELAGYRKIIADSIGAKEREIYFTSGGTESNNWALQMMARSLREKGRHIISSKIEHHSILTCLKFLEEEGYIVTYIDVDKEGVVKIQDIVDNIREDTILISIMSANNEIGSIQPITQIGEIAREYKIYFHTDAVQGYTHMEINVQRMNIDLLSASGHKFHGPKGIGFLYIRENVPIRAFIMGGGQERKRRAGTENIAAISGMAKAVELAIKNQSQNKKIMDLRNYMIQNLLKIPECYINGSLKHRLCNNIHIRFQGVSAELLLIMLDHLEIYAGSGAACSTGSLELSHVLLAIGQSEKEAREGIRFSLSHSNTKEEVDFVIEELKKIVIKLRR